MNGVNKYLQILTEFAEKKLNVQFKVDKLKYDNFGLVNSYLIYQSIKDKKIKKNTLIYLPDKYHEMHPCKVIFLINIDTMFCSELLAYTYMQLGH